jgi:hypothetical protein
MIRRFAFNYSENSYLHWLPLLIADRVNVVEGVLEDFTEGKVPNIFAEKGYNAEWKFNKTGLLTRLAVAAAITTAAVLLLTRNDDKDELDWDEK